MNNGEMLSGEKSFLRSNYITNYYSWLLGIACKPGVA